jgi:hypothetical protein
VTLIAPLLGSAHSPIGEPWEATMEPTPPAGPPHERDGLSGLLVLPKILLAVS